MPSVETRTETRERVEGCCKRSLPIKKRKISDYSTSGYLSSTFSQLSPSERHSNIGTSSSSNIKPLQVTTSSTFDDEGILMQKIQQDLEWTKAQLSVYDDLLLEVGKRKRFLNNLDSIIQTKFNEYDKRNKSQIDIQTQENTFCAKFYQTVINKNRNAFDDLWRQRYMELVQFKNENGHTNVPQRYRSNKPLGKWVHKQRQEFKKKLNGEPSMLSSDRIDALQKIGFQSSVCKRAEALWIDRYNELIVFWRKHGHCDVPQRYAPNKSLGKWVHSQRYAFKNWCDGKPSSLTLERVTALSRAGFRFRAHKHNI